MRRAPLSKRAVDPGWGPGNASSACEVERRAPLKHELELKVAGHGQAACTAAPGEVTLEILSVLRAQTGHTWSHLVTPWLAAPGQLRAHSSAVRVTIMMAARSYGHTAEPPRPV